MAKAIEQNQYQRTVGHFGVANRGDGLATIKQSVHDGDTISCRALGNFSVRFLGIDTPEISFTLPGQKAFKEINDAEWITFLTDPFETKYGPLNLDPGLRTYLQNQIGSDTALNHYQHAALARDELRQEITKDVTDSGGDEEAFEYYLAFASEVIDRYGRLLAFINRMQKETPRPLDYNGRQLKSGRASPYLIWPNIDPFRKQPSLIEAIPKPGTAPQIVTGSHTLSQAIDWVREARTQGLGIFDQHNPLKLQPFELRYLAGRRTPNRWVLDLSQNSDQLIEPQQYYRINNIEDRLYIPEEYVSLFIDAGWKA